MADQVVVAVVTLWNQRVGAVAWDEDRGYGTFEFDPVFLDGGLDPSPLMMPIATARDGTTRYAFRNLARDTFMGLPGLLADALPDRFGNRIIDAWLARQGRSAGSFSPVERLCYTGERAIGALEFAPPLHDALGTSVPVEIAELVDLVQTITDERSRLAGDLTSEPHEALLDLLRVGTSAGGARPKAVIVWNEATNELRSGQVEAPDGFDHWLLKFDGVADSAFGDPAGFGRIEFAYHAMAVAAGIEMTECRLLEEGTRAHFMTRRFDRPGGPAGANKLHMQSLCAIAHYDYNDPHSYTYELAFQVMRRLRLPYPDLSQQYRRMVFNVVARNQDDHTKNIAFLMDRDGEWRLAPAFDLTYAYNPSGDWTNRHHMSVAGKRVDFTRDDLLSVGTEIGIKNRVDIVDRVVEVVSDWPRFAGDVDVERRAMEAVGSKHRLL